MGGGDGEIAGGGDGGDGGDSAGVGFLHHFEGDASAEEEDGFAERWMEVF